MPRPKRPGAPEAKTRSRKGCWPCKARKVKCGEEKPACSNCSRQGVICDYSIRLNWDGRSKRKAPGPPTPLSGTMVMLHSPGPVTVSSASVDQDGLSTFSVMTPTTWAPESTWRIAPSPQETQSSHHSPVTPASIFANSPDYDRGHSYRHVGDPSTNQPEQVVSPPTLQEGPTQFEANQLQTSQALSYPSPSDLPFLRSGAGYLSALSFDSHPVSQPTSYLRQSIRPPTSTPDPPGDDHSQSHHAKRYKVSPDALPSIMCDQNRNSPQTGSLGAIDDTSSLHRVSVNSLLSQSVEPGIEPERLGYSSDVLQSQRLDSESVNFGLDCGFHDYDLNKNVDSAAIVTSIPVHNISREEQLSPTSDDAMAGAQLPRRKVVFTTGGYYAGPVQINIPVYLTPLPSTLQENPINLMYFHHFLNHTARILVPHDCEENPFISVLPSMAVTDPNLLNLMLAYSASHRARFLGHPEPSTRIAHWVSDVFPTLRHALHDPHENITDSHLATAIMLLSLKIVSPSTFEVPIPWQSHLKLARDLFLARGVQREANPENKVAFFLARWFGYLDILGSLSCRHSGPPLFEGSYWSSNDDDEHRVDCFTGYTPRSGIHLARLGHLTHRSDNERFDDAGNFLSDWVPSEDVALTAESLLDDMSHSRRRGYANGTHHTDQGDREMMAIDSAFHWSAVVHVHRRVLGKTIFAPEVREAIDELCNALARIQPGSSTEVSVLFPLFTAGCEMLDAQQRLEMMTRIKNFEAEGLKQIKNARKLMERCWEENVPWIALAQGEFLG